MTNSRGGGETADLRFLFHQQLTGALLQDNEPPSGTGGALARLTNADLPCPRGGAAGALLMRFPPRWGRRGDGQREEPIADSGGDQGAANSPHGAGESEEQERAGSISLSLLLSRASVKGADSVKEKPRRGSARHCC